LKKEIKYYCMEVIKIVIIFAVVYFVQQNIVGTCRVSGQSMYPTLNNENENKSLDRVIVERISNYTRDYFRGEVVLIKSHDSKDNIYIKRIIGLSNEEIEIKNGKVYINGEELEEPYLPAGTKTYPDLKIKIPEESVFVLGDNRYNSADSRILGTIQHKDVVGHAFLRFNILGLDGGKIQ